MPRNQYRQILVTMTQVHSDQFTLHVQVKPVGQQWHSRHRVALLSFRVSDPPGTMEAALELLQSSLAGLITEVGPETR